MDNVFDARCIISPSLISCGDICHLENSVRQIEAAGIDLLHVDILDGHFSPSMPIGFDTVRAVKNISNISLDAHVMTDGNDYYVDELISIGVQQIVFHIETEKHVDNMLNHIHSAGIRAGVALKPSTPLTEIEYIIEKCDAVLLMLINPGYASSEKEAQVSYASKKIMDLSNMIKRRELDTKVILDGRISRDNLKEYGATSLADIFVCGSTCLNKHSLESSIHDLLEFRKTILE